MEDTLRVDKAAENRNMVFVLILVLMEDTLRVVYFNEEAKNYELVLILVLMEDTLRE